MGSKQKRRRIRISARLVAGLLLLAAAVASLGAQQRVPELQLSDTLVAPGERITAELFVPDARVAEVDFLLPALPERLTLVGEPLLTESRRRVGSSVVLGVLVILQVEANEAGRTLFPSLRVEGPGFAPVVTEERLIEISLDGTRAGVPFDLAWRRESGRILPGQTVPVYLEMRNLLDLRYPDEILVDSPVTGVFEEVRGLGEVRSRSVGETTLYDVPVAVFLLTPTESSEITIPAALVTLGELERRSAALSVPVGSLESAPDSGAIGSFDFAVTVSREEGLLTEPLTVTMRVSGTGNLPFLGFPEIRVENLIELDRQEELRQSPTVSGYRGERTVTIRLAPGEGQSGTLAVADFDYVAPDSRRRVVVPGETFRYTLAGGGVAATPEALEISLAEAGEILAEEMRFSYRSSSSYLLFLIGPGLLLVVVVSLVIQRRRVPVAPLLLFLALSSAALLSGQMESLTARLEEAADLFDRGEYDAARDRYFELTEELPHNGPLYHNLGAAAYYAGDRGVAVFGLREAARYAPGRESFWAALEAVEGSYGLSQQLEVTRFLDPDTLLIGLLLFFNIGLPLVVLIPVRAKGQRVIAVSIFFLLSAVAGGALYQAHRIQQSGRGVVVADGAEVLRIPEPDADPWLSLEEGTAVQVELGHADFLLVRTGLGVEGWIEKESVLTPPAGGNR